MTSTFTCRSPIDGGIVCERPHASEADIDKAIAEAASAARTWRETPLAERTRVVAAAVDWVMAHKQDLAADITRQMGRPIRYTPGEIGGFEERSRYMIDIAPAALADVKLPAKPGFDRYIRRSPVGPVFVIAPWNYPWLTSVNAIVPALLAGNPVILKHSAQTPLVAEAYGKAFEAAGLPKGVFRYLHLTHDQTSRIIGAPEIRFVAFTGSVPGGKAVEQAAAGRFIGLGLELGGKDPGYVRADADLDGAVGGLIDGAFFNSGQSCCGIERIYVHKSLFDGFVEKAVALTNEYVLGDPMDQATTLGPMVRASAADFVRKQIADAVAAGAKTLIDTKAFKADKPGTPYMAPQIVVGVDHSMDLMLEESFGPVVGIMPVADDEEALKLMNDSAYGLTAAVYTKDADAAARLGERLDTGTVFMNRCDYLDPALAWTGVKDSGRGCTLSSLGYEQLTQPKSFHLKTGA